MLLRVAGTIAVGALLCALGTQAAEATAAGEKVDGRTVVTQSDGETKDKEMRQAKPIAVNADGTCALQSDGAAQKTKAAAKAGAGSDNADAAANAKKVSDE